MTKINPAKRGQEIKIAFQSLVAQGKDTLNESLFRLEVAKTALFLEHIQSEFDFVPSAQIGQALNFAYETAKDKSNFVEIMKLTDEYLGITQTLQEESLDTIYTKVMKEYPEELQGIINEISKV